MNFYCGLYLLVCTIQVSDTVPVFSQIGIAEDGEAVVLVCKDDSVTAQVEFFNPSGSSESKCNAPLGGTPGACQAGLSQNINTGYTNLTISSFSVADQTGTWKCKHGLSQTDFYVQGVVIPTFLNTSKTEDTYTIELNCSYPTAQIDWELVSKDGGDSILLDTKNCTAENDGSCPAFSGSLTLPQNQTKYKCVYTLPKTVKDASGCYNVKGSLSLIGQKLVSDLSKVFTYNETISFGYIILRALCFVFLIISLVAAGLLYGYFIGYLKYNIKGQHALKINIALAVFALVVSVAVIVWAYLDEPDSSAVPCKCDGSDCKQETKYYPIAIGLLGLLVPLAVVLVLIFCIEETLFELTIPFEKKDFDKMTKDQQSGIPNAVMNILKPVSGHHRVECLGCESGVLKLHIKTKSKNKNKEFNEILGEKLKDTEIGGRRGCNFELKEKSNVKDGGYKEVCGGFFLYFNKHQPRVSDSKQDLENEETKQDLKNEETYRTNTKIDGKNKHLPPLDTRGKKQETPTSSREEVASREHVEVTVDKANDLTENKADDEDSKKKKKTKKKKRPLPEPIINKPEPQEPLPPIPGSQ